jgi:hypothetical protein
MSDSLFRELFSPNFLNLSLHVATENQDKYLDKVGKLFQT